MKVDRIFIMLVVLALLSFRAQAADTNSSIAQDAAAAYDSGDFKLAVAKYSELVGMEPLQGDHYYNLANSYFRAGDLSLAILNYEKALLLLPRDHDVRHNLEHAKKLLEYRIEDKRNWYVRAAENAFSYVTRQEALILFLAALWIFLLSVVFYFAKRSFVFWTELRKIIALVFIVVAIFAAAKYYDADGMRDAIVTTEGAEMRFGPSIRNQVAVKLGAGLKVYVTQAREDWMRIRLVSGETGWIRAGDIGLVEIDSSIGEI